MTDFQIKIHWGAAITITVLLFVLLVILMPSLPDFSDLGRIDGTVDVSTVDTRLEAGKAQTVFMVTLEGRPNTTFVVLKGPDPGYYRATQTVASGDEISIWDYPINQSQDLRVWQLSDRDQLIVNYNDVYGVVKHDRVQIVVTILLLMAVVNGWTYLTILRKTTEPPTPRLLEMGE